MTHSILKVIFVAALTSLAAPLSANEVSPIYGHQLMTQEERMAHQQAMRNAKTPEERALIRERHHQKMRLRAKEKGVPFPDKPPMKRGHVNQKDRPGMGYGRGQ